MTFDKLKKQNAEPVLTVLVCSHSHLRMRKGTLLLSRIRYILFSLLGAMQLFCFLATRQLYQKLSVLLARENAAPLLNRFPTLASPDIDGVE